MKMKQESSAMTKLNRKDVLFHKDAPGPGSYDFWYLPEYMDEFQVVEVEGDDGEVTGYVAVNAGEGILAGLARKTLDEAIQDMFKAIEATL